MAAQIGDERVRMADFTHLPTHCKYIALMPQWDFLNFLAEQGKRYPGFDLRMQAEATGLIEEGGRVAGVRAKTRRRAAGGPRRLVVGADGRHSTVREQRRASRRRHRRADGRAVVPAVAHGDRREPRPSAISRPGKMLVMLDRGDYWQCAYVIPKGGIEAIKADGLDAFRAECRRHVAVAARPRSAN